MTTLADDSTAQRCRNTPTVTAFDNRSLAVRTLQYNRTAPTDPLDGRVTRRTYSARGHLSSSIDPRLWSRQQLEPTTAPNFHYVCSLSGNALRIHSQDAGCEVALHDSAGGVIWQQDARAQQLSRTFDRLRRLTTVHEWIAGVNRVSDRLRYADSNADANSNLRGKLLQAFSTAGMTRTQSCGINGQLLSSQQQFLRDDIVHSDWDGDDQAAWDAALNPERFISAWTYDVFGQQLQLTDAKGNQQRQRFNIAGRLVTSELLLDGHNTAQTVLCSVDYHAAGPVLREEAGNGVASDYVYEPQTQRLSTLTTTRPAKSGRAPLLQALAYQYDPVGNLLTVNDTAKAIHYSGNQQVLPTCRYTYDALYQLCQATGRENATVGQQGMDLPHPIVPLAQGNDLSHYTRTYRYDRGHNLIETRHVGAQSFSQQMVVARTSNRAVVQSGGLTPDDVDRYFDACGNLQQLAAGQPLAWNSRNQLLRTLQVARSDVEHDSEMYWYDASGQRTTKLTSTQTSGTTRTQRVRYLPGLELRESEQNTGSRVTPLQTLHLIQLGATGHPSVRVLHWELGKPAQIDNNQWRYSLDDQKGSSQLEVDHLADILTWEAYYPFGGTCVWSGRNETETHYKFIRYSGKERDTTGLYYYGFRYYAPWLRRWLNPDPAGTVDGLNLYCMVSNNPVRYGDRDGCSSIKFEDIQELDKKLKDPNAKKAIETLTSAIDFFKNNSYRLHIEKFSATQNKLTIEWDRYMPGFEPSTERRNSEFALEGNYSEAFQKDLLRLKYTVNNNETETELKGYAPSSDGILAEKLKTFEQLVPNSQLRTDISRRAHQGVLADVQRSIQTMLKENYFPTNSDTLFEIKPTDEMDRSEIRATVVFKVTNSETELQVPGATISLTRTLFSTLSEPREQRMDAVQYGVSIAYETPPASPSKSYTRRIASYLGKAAIGKI